jgi:CheY-like chemotaxis protein
MMVSDYTRKRRLLVVDDELQKRLQWREAAERAADFDIAEAETFASALELLGAEGTDIMVTDLFLTPESAIAENIEEADGIRLIEHCRERFPRSKIVAVTGKSGVGTEIGAGALEAGADDFISANWQYVDPAKLLEQKLRIFDHVLSHTPEPTLS